MPIDDKTLSFSALIHLKYLNSAYHTAITEAGTESLKRDFMDLYRDEQNNLYKLFNVMQARGWYQSPQPAEPTQINQARQRFESDAQKAFAGVGAHPGIAGTRPDIGVQPPPGGQAGARGQQFGGPRPQI
ncbi:MAG: spore coat protein [Firmicutes bacterium]|nr:spore coat protein [Bacillota bacterium]